MEQKLSDTLVKAIYRSNPMMQNLQLASRFNKLVEQGGGGGGGADLEDNKKISITENGTVEITPTEGKDGMKKVTATVNVSSGGGGEDKLLCYYIYTGRSNTCVVYTDKPAKKIYAGETSSSEQSILPVDDGKHLFITNIDLTLMTGSDQYVDISYTDGTSASLKGKFVAVS